MMKRIKHAANGYFSGKAGGMYKGPADHSTLFMAFVSNFNYSTMKTLKNLIIISAGMMIILLSLLACRTENFYQTARASSSEIQMGNTRIEANSSSSYRGTEMISMDDSRDQDWRVYIYPKHTFFILSWRALREGFKSGDQWYSRAGNKPG